MADLKVGDMVLWRGNFGFGPAKRTIVEAIYVIPSGMPTHYVESKYSVPSLPWSDLSSRRVVITIENKHWAYGTQIDPVT